METKSGLGASKRTGIERLEAIPNAVAWANDFKSRLSDATGDAARLANMMAEAIAKDRESRGLECVGRDGRIVMSMERLVACHAMDDARAAYLEACGSNSAASG